jgi:acyl carrier protein
VSFEQFTGAVADFIARKADLDRAKIHPDYDFLEAGLLDSVSLIELFFFVEEKFGEELLPGEFQMAEMNTPANFYQRYVRTQEPAGHAAEI